MQNNQDYPNLFFSSQPSFNFEPFSCSFLEPQFQNLNLNDKMQTQEKPKVSRTNMLHKRKIKRLEAKVKELERELKELKNEKKRKNSCENGLGSSRVDLNSSVISEGVFRTNDPGTHCLADIQQQQEALADTFLSEHHPVNTSNPTLEFERFQMTPHPPEYTQLELNGQTWIAMGMLMMIMGININGYDGSIDAYKITRETVDSIRKQVEKSKEEIVFPVFYSKLFSIEGVAGMEAAPLDGCFELEGLRLESINEEDLMFEEHLNFTLKYEALIVMMEYMKQYAYMA